MSDRIIDLDTASRAVPYGAKGSAERAAYVQRRAEIEQQVRDFLAAEYAPTFTSAQQELLWEKAYADGHANGYSEIEYHYVELAEFANKFRG